MMNIEPTVIEFDDEIKDLDFEDGIDGYDEIEDTYKNEDIEYDNDIDIDQVANNDFNHQYYYFFFK